MVTRVEGRLDAAPIGWPDIAAWAHVVRGYMALGQGETGKAYAAFEAGVALFQETDDPRGLADCLTGFGAVCMWRRALEDAIRHYRAAYALHERTGDLYELGAILRGMANVRHCSGDVDGAAELLERARSCFEHNGNRYNVATCLNDLGEIARSRGDADRAAKLYRKSARLFESLGCDDASTPRFNVGLVLLARGDHEKARTVFEAELDRLAASKRTIDLLWLHVGLLPCTAAARDWEEWDLHFERVDALLEDFVDEDIAWCARLGGKLAVQAEDRARARRAFELARAQWQRIGNAVEVERVDADLAAL
jgi:tetratricopeptide (TPR) repeat protein